MFAHKLPPLITSATTDDLWTAPPPPRSQQCARRGDADIHLLWCGSILSSYLQWRVCVFVKRVKPFFGQSSLSFAISVQPFSPPVFCPGDCFAHRLFLTLTYAKGQRRRAFYRILSPPPRQQTHTHTLTHPNTMHTQKCSGKCVLCQHFLSTSIEETRPYISCHDEKWCEGGQGVCGCVCVCVCVCVCMCVDGCVV